jgi:hypothetical protein
MRDGKTLGFFTIEDGWAEAARKMRERGDDKLERMSNTRFDDGEWEWR